MLICFNAHFVTMPLPSGITDECTDKREESGAKDKPRSLDHQNNTAGRILTAFEKVLADTARRRAVNAKREAAMSLKQKSMASGDHVQLSTRGSARTRVFSLRIHQRIRLGNIWRFLMTVRFCHFEDRPWRYHQCFCLGVGE